MYKIEDLTKEYTSRRGAVVALNSVSLSIPRRSFVTITGASGSGKTTLLLALGGLIHPSSGRIDFEGRDLCRQSPAELAAFRNQRVGFVLQTFNLVPYLSAVENVMLPMLFAHNLNGDARSRAESLLDRVGLLERKSHLPRELSVGQQQRVAIARALANNPDVILADEPTGNLDPSLSLEILHLLRDFHQTDGRTVIMVTHSPLAAEFGTIRLRLRDGVLVS